VEVVETAAIALTDMKEVPATGRAYFTEMSVDTDE
jgi:hypothetical protein